MEAAQNPNGEEQIPIEEMSYSQLNTAGWNAYHDRDMAFLSDIAAQAEARRIKYESEAGSGVLELESYSTLSRSLFRSLDNLRTYLEREQNG